MTSDGNGGIVLDGQFQNPVVEPWAQRFGSIRGFPYMEVSENGRFTENPIKMDDLGVPQFYGNHYLVIGKELRQRRYEY